MATSSEAAEIPYRAACPVCGQEAPWRSVLRDLRVELGYIKRVTVVEAECDCTCEAA